MNPTLIVLLFTAVSVGVLGFVAMRDHRRALAARAGLLGAVLADFDGGGIEIGRDGFPTLIAPLDDGRTLTVTLLPDTLVTRRLPQLWLIVTLRDPVETKRPSIGALARYTGAEFYSRALEFPERLVGPPGFDQGLLLRGERRLDAADLQRACRVLGSIFHDPQVKEIAATPRGVRIVRQASEGERGAHLILRQVRFPVERISPELVRRCVADAEALRESLDTPDGVPLKLSA